ncbi:MAG: chromosome partition protein MukB [Pseudomonadota bacterium]|nr:chromosome partition protein MukB [Pseudomonadota bacterium]
MSRARIEALALVNWKGVFYERYQFDRAVTALEGANGAGKTTVMIAAYVALFPEIGKLRFTNLGEHEATKGDRGIYGRLGREGWPSFTVLDLRFGRNERVLAGVKLDRKNEPVVELEPFLVRGLSEDVRLQDVLLDIRQEDDRTVDRLLDKTRLVQRVARAGGTLKWLEPRQYFRELFDLGLTPLRLDSDEERTRFNDMLRTSMIGGISRTLSGGLRDFVLREDSNLAESLRAMRDNLAACQVTRREVEESGVAQKEITDVYRSAETMFTRAVHAARVRSEEQALALQTARTRQEDAVRHTQKATERLEASGADVARAEDGERSAEDAARRASEWRGRLEKAAGVAAQRHRAMTTRSERREQWARARDAEARATEALEAARGARDAAVSERDTLSLALSSSRQAWRELSRRAGLYTEATERHTALIERLGEPVRPRAAFEPLLAEKRARVGQLDGALTEARRTIAGAEAARRDFNDVASALDRVVAALAGIGECEPGPVAPADAWDRGQAMDAVLRELRGVVGEREALGQRLRVATQRADQQRALRERLHEMGLEIGSAAALIAASDRARDEREVLAGTLGDGQRRHDAAQAQLKGARTRLGELDKELPRWRAVQALGREIAGRVAELPAEVAGLFALEAQLGSEVHRLRAASDAASTLARDHRAEADRLASSEGGLAADLVEACEVVDGELVVRRFDEVGLEDAAATEALLGPLRKGILVRDPSEAAARLLAHGDLPDEVWLVSAVADTLPGERHTSGVVVREGGAVRVSRNPERPVLGAEARRRHVAELREGAVTADADAHRFSRETSAAADTAARIRDLAREASRWLAPDPALEQERVRCDAALATTAVEDAAREQAIAVGAHARAVDRDVRLAKLVPDAHLLDAGDATAERDDVKARLDRVGRVAPALERCREAAAILVRRLSVLQVVPPSVAEVVELRTRQQALEAERDREDTDARALEWLVSVGDALSWTDAPEQLRSAELGEQSLQHAHAAATVRATSAEAAWTEAEAASAEAKLREGTARHQMDAAAQHVEGLERDLAELGVGEPDPGTVDAAREAEAASGEALHAAKRGANEARDGRTRAEIARGAAVQSELDARESLARAEVQAKPAQDAWTALSAEIELRSLTTGIFAEPVLEAVRDTNSIHLSQQALRAQGVLRTHLEHAAQAGRLIAMMEGGEADDLRWEHYVRTWLGVRAWVRQRVPSNVSESDDPVKALADLGRHLVSLSGTLMRQEEQLKGSSATVANHIGQSLRRATMLISRLSAELEAVHFGSIRRVDVQARRRPEMNKLLDALKGEQAQGALFQPGVTLENALAAIYQRETGGRIAGERLLDYREYLELSVRVQREGSTEWEPANATRMSTGEAIGVGAALMMVVLTAWERRETLGRAARKHGSLRFLFLDEANRLSQDNLKTLFELCDNLELQLLVAAPEVAQSEGNITYRLVRRLVGGESVVDVSGRRTEA